MPRRKTTIHELMLEMQSFGPVNEQLIKKAEGLKLKADDQDTFNDALTGWSRGRYDESPESLVYTLEAIVGKYP